MVAFVNFILKKMVVVVITAKNTISNSGLWDVKI